MTKPINKIVVGLLMATPGLLAAAESAGKIPPLQAAVFAVAIVGGLCIFAWGLSDLCNTTKSGSS